jgi:hypothetical protein
LIISRVGLVSMPAGASVNSALVPPLSTFCATSWPLT